MPSPHILLYFCVVPNISLAVALFFSFPHVLKGATISLSPFFLVLAPFTLPPDTPNCSILFSFSRSLSILCLVCPSWAPSKRVLLQLFIPVKSYFPFQRASPSRRSSRSTLTSSVRWLVVLLTAPSGSASSVPSSPFLFISSPLLRSFLCPLFTPSFFFYLPFLYFSSFSSSFIVFPSHFIHSFSTLIAHGLV